MYVSTTYRVVYRKLQRCLRLKYLKLKKISFEGNKFVYSSAPFVSDVIVDRIDNHKNLIYFNSLKVMLNRFCSLYTIQIFGIYSKYNFNSNATY